VAVLVAAAVLAAAPHADATLRQDPQLSDLSLTEPAIHAVGVTGTGLPKKTHLLPPPTMGATPDAWRR